MSQDDRTAFLNIIDTWRQLLNYKIERVENKARLGRAEVALCLASGLR